MPDNSKPIARSISQIEFEERSLPNGLHLIMHNDTSTPIVAVDIWYHVGSKDEDKGKTGFAHLFEHMMFQGSCNVKRTEHFKFIQHAGGTLNGSTTHDRTNYFETLPSNNLSLALWLEADRMGCLNVNEENFSNQRDVVKEEKLQRQDNVPYGTKWLNLFSRLYENEPYGWMPIGSMEDLDNATVDDAQNFYEKYYTPSNAVVVISGDINYNEAYNFTEKYFGGIKSGNTRKKQFPEIKFHKGGEKETVYDSVQIPALFMGYKIPGLGAKEAPAIELFNSILGQSKSSRLYSNIVYGKNLAKSVNSYIWENELGGLLIVSAMGYLNSDIDEIEKAVSAEINELLSGGISDEEVEKAKNNLETDLIEGMQTNIGKAENLAYFRTFFNNTNMINTIFEKYSDITEKDITKSAVKYLSNDNRVILHYKNKSLKTNHIIN